MNKKDIILSWKKDHASRQTLPSTPVKILPGYRLDFGDREQLTLNFEAVIIRENSPEMAIMMYRRFR